MKNKLFLLLLACASQLDAVIVSTFALENPQSDHQIVIYGDWHYTASPEGYHEALDAYLDRAKDTATLYLEASHRESMDSTELLSHLTKKGIFQDIEVRSSLKFLMCSAMYCLSDCYIKDMIETWSGTKIVEGDEFRQYIAQHRAKAFNGTSLPTINELIPMLITVLRHDQEKIRGFLSRLGSNPRLVQAAQIGLSRFSQFLEGYIKAFSEIASIDGIFQLKEEAIARCIKAYATESSTLLDWNCICTLLENTHKKSIVFAGAKHAEHIAQILSNSCGYRIKYKEGIAEEDSSRLLQIFGIKQAGLLLKLATNRFEFMVNSFDNAKRSLQQA